MRAITRRILLSGTMAATLGPMIGTGRGTAEERVGLRLHRWAADTWRSLVVMTDERTGLTATTSTASSIRAAAAATPRRPTSAAICGAPWSRSGSA